MSPPSLFKKVGDIGDNGDIRESIAISFAEPEQARLNNSPTPAYCGENGEVGERTAVSSSTSPQIVGKRGTNSEPPNFPTLATTPKSPKSPLFSGKAGICRPAPRGANNELLFKQYSSIGGGRESLNLPQQALRTVFFAVRFFYFHS